MASISRRGDGWRVLWRRGGRDGETQSVTFATEKTAQEAKKRIDGCRNELTAAEVYHAILGTPLPQTPADDKPPLPTVSEFAETWLQARTRITPGTKGRYRRQLDLRILPAIGHLTLDEVSGTHIAAFIHDLRQDGLTDSTATRYYAVLHSLFRFAVAEYRHHMHDNPVRRVDFIRDQVAHDDIGDDDHVYLSRAEFNLILANADPRARPLLLFLVETGARWSEATALDIRDVDLLATPPVARIVKAWKQDEEGRWYRGATKGRNKRAVKLPRRAANPLLGLTVDSPDKLLFRAPQGGRVIHNNFSNRVWRPALAGAMRCDAHPPVDAGGSPDLRPLAESSCDCPTRLRQRPTPHDLRHTHVAWLIMAGRPMAEIAKRIGHHSTAVTEKVYAGILPEVSDATVAALDAADEATAHDDATPADLRCL